jgi:hypothetical protein
MAAKGAERHVGKNVERHAMPVAHIAIVPEKAGL